MSRKPDALDLMKLYTQGSAVEWNNFLTNCFKKRDLEKLATTRRQLQAGMAKIAKQKLNTEKIELFFIRLQNSLENTMKKIVRAKMPNPCDNPLKAKDWLHKKGDKKLRDENLERYLKKTGY